MLRSLLATAVLTGALAGVAQAQVSVTSPAAVKPGVYTVEPNHTRVLFAVSHLGFTTYFGNFTGVSGSLTLDPKKPSASAVSITIPVKSVSTTNAVLDGELKAADWLDASADPEITFKSTSVTPTGHGNANIAGDLTLHGVTKPVVLAAKFNGAGTDPIIKAYTVGFDATTKIKRSDFGVTKYVPLVGDEVTVTISAAFVQK
jgi:polyisoprenoid-binding protein YceI